MRTFLAALVNQAVLKTREGDFVDMPEYSTWCYLLCEAIMAKAMLHIAPVLRYPHG